MGHILYASPMKILLSLLLFALTSISHATTYKYGNVQNEFYWTLFSEEARNNLDENKLKELLKDGAKVNAAYSSSEGDIYPIEMATYEAVNRGNFAPLIFLLQQNVNKTPHALLSPRRNPLKWAKDQLEFQQSNESRLNTEITIRLLKD